MFSKTALPEEVPTLVLPKISDRYATNHKRVSSYSIAADYSEDMNLETAPKYQNLKSLRLKDSQKHLIVDKRLLISKSNTSNKNNGH